MGLPISSISLNETKNKIIVNLANKDERVEKEVYSIVPKELVEINYTGYALPDSRADAQYQLIQ